MNKFKIVYIPEEEIEKYTEQGYTIKFMRFYDLNKKSFMAIKEEKKDERNKSR